MSEFVICFSIVSGLLAHAGAVTTSYVDSEGEIARIEDATKGYAYCAPFDVGEKMVQSMRAPANARMQYRLVDGALVSEPDEAAQAWLTERAARVARDAALDALLKGD